MHLIAQRPHAQLNEKRVGLEDEGQEVVINVMQWDVMFITRYVNEYSDMTATIDHKNNDCHARD